MLSLANKVKIGNYILAGVISVEIESSWEMLTDTCKITVPANIRHDGKFVNLAESRLIKKGDKVQVELGYDGNLELIFEGFVDQVQAGAPVTISCQDYMWLLKKDAQNRSYKTVTLAALLADILPSEVSFKTQDVSLGQFRINKATAAQVLEEVKKTYILHSFFRNSTLYAGLAYWPELAQTHTFEFTKNIIEESSQLEFRTAEDVKLKVRTVSMLPDNTKIEIDLGDPDGEERTLHFYNLQKGDLEKAANEEIKRLRYDGYAGNFVTFGAPVVRHNDIVVIKDPRYSREGRYQVKKVITTFSVDSGYRQDIHIDRKV